MRTVLDGKAEIWADGAADKGAKPAGFFGVVAVNGFIGETIPIHKALKLKNRSTQATPFGPNGENLFHDCDGVMLPGDTFRGFLKPGEEILFGTVPGHETRRAIIEFCSYTVLSSEHRVGQFIEEQVPL